MFSWYTQDTNHRIINDEPFKVIFGGKDYYELLAEMNGYTHDIVEYRNGEPVTKREKGIELAFDGDPTGRNPNVLHPSITESGEYFDGIAPESDPNQGFEEEYC